MAKPKKKKRKECRAKRHIGKIVTGFTLANDEQWLPPSFAVGVLATYYVETLDYNQYLVGGVSVDPTTITPISNPTSELIRVLKTKSREWQRQNTRLANRRGREDSRFREKSMNREFEVHLVRKDQQEAFSTFYDEMVGEDQRITAERKAEVAKLVKRFTKKAR